MQAPGRLLATGREADVYEYGPGLVLRRSRAGHPQTLAVQVMTYVASQGFPVPTVYKISDDGVDVVMDRVDGKSMADHIAARPWRLNYFADQLADLQAELHAVEPPSWIADFPARLRAPQDTLVHLDLHPLNVIVASEGPVVIDWTNASRGHWADDVATSWLVLSSAEIPGGGPTSWLIAALRQRFVKRFLNSFDLDEVRARLAIVAEWKTVDPNMSPDEVDRIATLVAELGG